MANLVSDFAQLVKLFKAPAINFYDVGTLDDIVDIVVLKRL